MSNVDQEELPLDAPEDEHYQTEPEPEQPREYVDTTLWKKWSVFGGKGRFLTIRPWSEAAKVAVDIGETGEGSSLLGHSLVWANMLQLAAYLQAVSNGRAEAIYKMNPKAGVPTNEGFSHYGGANIEGQPVSRILKVHHWQQEKDKYDPSAFVWKCGHFKARKSSTGAFIPDMRAPISIHSIKVSRQEMNELALALSLALTNHAARTETIKWLEEISGRTKR
jgi:hypothetical protein